MAAQWKFVKDSTPLESLHNILSGSSSSWHHAPILPSEEHPQSPGRLQHLYWTTFIHCICSKAFWRVVLALTALLPILNLLRDELGRYAEGVRETWRGEDVDWSQYAYCQYVTNTDYLCNSLMIFDSLQRVGSKASRVMMYPEGWEPDETTNEGRLLIQARDEFAVDLQPIQVQHLHHDDVYHVTWADSFTKLLAFNQNKYKRVLSLDSDATALQSMDELFLLPTAPVAMPRAYWLPEKPFFLSTQLILAEPSEVEFAHVLAAFKHLDNNTFDMEIVNDLYGKDYIIIPHRRYDLLTSEFRAQEHHLFLGSKKELWDPDEVYKEAKFLHFSDWPLPKPWRFSSPKDREKIAPKCLMRGDGTEDCRDRDMWYFVYQDFHDRRERVCGSDFVKDNTPGEALLLWHKSNYTAINSERFKDAKKTSLPPPTRSFEGSEI